MSILSLTKYHPLKNNSFTPQPDNHLAHTPYTHIHSQHPNKCAPTPTYSYTLTNTQQRVKRHHRVSTDLSSFPLGVPTNLSVSPFALSPWLSMTIIAPIILKLTYREERMAADWWMETEKPAAWQIPQFFIHHTAWPSLLCCISMETNRLLGPGYSR